MMCPAFTQKLPETQFSEISIDPGIKTTNFKEKWKIS